MNAVVEFKLWLAVGVDLNSARDEASAEEIIRSKARALGLRVEHIALFEQGVIRCKLLTADEESRTVTVARGFGGLG